MQARKRAGFASASDAAKALGVKEPTYLGHENGSRGFKKASAEQYARRFGVSLEWLLTGRETGARASPHKTPAAGPEKIIHIPLLDSVTAGKLRVPSSQIPVEDVPLLAFADLGRGEWFALKVEGDSMDRVSPDGSRIIINRADRNLVSGKAYVFSIRGETTYKVWRPEPARLAPYSTNPMHEPIFVKSRKDAEGMVIGRVKRTVLDL
ncbi:LexA family transcriptional regulator [Afipia sp. TerB]